MSALTTAFYGSAWALEINKLREIELVIRNRFLVQRGRSPVKKLKVKASPSPKAAASDGKPYAMHGKLALIPVHGTICQKMNLFTEFSGGTSTERIGRLLDAAVADPDVGTVVMNVDSPGGSVFGVPELARKVFDARSRKRIVAFVDPLMASAAYWIGSAAHEIVMTPSGYAGSIGVYTLHVDYSRALDTEGVKPTFISAGKYKVDGNPYEPMSETFLKDTQADIDWWYTQFVGDVARNRGTTPDAVRKGFGEGRVENAGSAIGAGLVDRIATWNQLLRDEQSKAEASSSTFASTHEDLLQAQRQLELEADLVAGD